MLRSEAKIFFAALRFFTRIPVPAWVGHSQQQLDRAARYFPLVGALVGAIGAGATLIAAHFLPVSLALLLGMVATTLATGAFHEDGLADACDGLGGGWDKLQVLTIMKDSRVGSYGVLGLGFVLLIKFTALQELEQALGQLEVALVLVCAHAFSRLGPVLLMRALSYVREDETARSKPLAKSLDATSQLVALSTGALACGALSSISLAVAITAALALLTTCALCGRYFVVRIGGYTGDCLGATQQLAEVAVYLAVLAAGSSI